MLRAIFIRALTIALIAFGGCSFDGGQSRGEDDASVDASKTDASPIPLDTFRRSITVLPSGLTASVENLPIAIRIGPDDDFGAAVSAVGTDLLVVDASGTQLPLEIESINKEMGTLVAWALLPTVPVEGTTVYLYYGNAVPSKARVSPWTDFADLVWHFNSVADRTTMDSSPSDFDGETPQLAGALIGTSGIFGSGVAIDRASLQVSDPSVLNRIDDSFTVSLWFQQRNARDLDDLAFFKGGPSFGSPGYEITVGTGQWRASIRDDEGLTRNRNLVFGQESVLGANATWHHLVMVVDRDGNQIIAYLDGDEVDSDNLNGIQSLDNDSDAARTGGMNQELDGFVDELRTMPTAMSADWVSLAYANGMEPDFISIGGHEEAAYPGTAPPNRFRSSLSID